MRPSRLLLVLVVAWGGACAALGRNTVPAERMIASLEEDWIRYAVARDAAGFDRLLAPGFVYTEDDRVYTRDALIREISTAADTVTSGRNEDMQVHVSGTTAIVTGWLVLSGHGPGGPFERRYRFTDTWLFTDGRWQVLAAQDYLKP